MVLRERKEGEGAGLARDLGSSFWRGSSELGWARDSQRCTLELATVLT